MANKILQFATFIGFSKEHGIKIVNPSFYSYAEHFENSSTNFFCSYPSQRTFLKPGKKIRAILYYMCYFFARVLKRLHLDIGFFGIIDIEWDIKCELSGREFLALAKTKKILFVQGWQFRDVQNMIKYREDIISYFKPKEVYQKEVDRLVTKARVSCDILIGVHIRQGDYKAFSGGKYYYDTSEYVKQMTYLFGLFSYTKVRFLICSDTRQLQNNFDNLDVVYGTGNPVEDMYSLSYCDYIIGPPSTYTMWASFYGNIPLCMLESSSEFPAKTDFKLPSEWMKSG